MSSETCQLEPRLYSCSPHCASSVATSQATCLVTGSVGIGEYQGGYFPDSVLHLPYGLYKLKCSLPGEPCTICDERFEASHAHLAFGREREYSLYMLLVPRLQSMDENMCLSWSALQKGYERTLSPLKYCQGIVLPNTVEHPWV